MKLRCSDCADLREPGCYECNFTGWGPEWLVRLDMWATGASYRLNHLLTPNRDCPDCGAPMLRWWKWQPPCDCQPF